MFILYLISKRDVSSIEIRRMNWIDIIIGFLVILAGIIWFIYEYQEFKRSPKEVKLTYPSTFLGIYIVLAIGVALIIRAL